MNQSIYLSYVLGENIQFLAKKKNKNKYIWLVANQLSTLKKHRRKYKFILRTKTNKTRAKVTSLHLFSIEIWILYKFLL